MNKFQKILISLLSVNVLLGAVLVATIITTGCKKQVAETDGDTNAVPTNAVSTNVVSTNVVPTNAVEGLK